MNMKLIQTGWVCSSLGLLNSWTNICVFFFFTWNATWRLNQPKNFYYVSVITPNYLPPINVFNQVQMCCWNMPIFQRQRLFYCKSSKEVLLPEIDVNIPMCSIWNDVFVKKRSAARAGIHSYLGTHYYKLQSMGPPFCVLSSISSELKRYGHTLQLGEW